MQLTTEIGAGFLLLLIFLVALIYICMLTEEDD